MLSSSSSFSSQITIDADRERIFDVLTGLEAAANWIHGILGIERRSDGPMGPGFRWREERLVLGDKVAEDIAVVGYDPPRVFAVTCTDVPKGKNGGDAPGNGESRTLTYTLIEGDGPEQTVLRLDVRVDTPGLVGRVLNRFRIDTVRKMAEKDLFALKRFIETGRRASGVFIAVG